MAINKCHIALRNICGSNLTDVTIFYRKGDGSKNVQLAWPAIPYNGIGPEQEIDFNPVNIYDFWHLQFKNAGGLQYQNSGWKRCALVEGDANDSGSHQEWRIEVTGGVLTWVLNLDSGPCTTRIEQENWVALDKLSLSESRRPGADLKKLRAV